MTSHFPLAAQIALVIFILFGLSAALGHMIPRSLTGSSITTRIGFGYAFILIGCGFSVRYSVPSPYSLVASSLWICTLILILNFIIRLTNPISNIKLYSSDFSINPGNERYPEKNFIAGILAIIFFASFFFFIPELIAKSPILQNKGPDLDGHLLSAAFIIQGGTREDLLSLFGPSLYRWDYIPLFHTWDYPNFVSSAAIEFLFRSNRVGHAGLVAILYQLTKISPVLILLSCMCFASALTAGIIFDQLHKRGLFIAFFGSSILIVSQSILIQRIEGIVAQLIALPLITILLIRLSSTSLDAKLKSISIGVLLCAISQTFGEGAQFLGLIIGLYFLYYLVDYLYGKKLLYPALTQPLIIGFTLIICDPLNFVEFIKWTIYRTRLDFSGGALHLNWSFFDVLFNFSHYRVVAPVKSILIPHYWMGLVMAAIGICIIKKIDLKKNIVLIIGMVSLLIPYLIGHQYAFWKCETIFLPFLIISYLSIESRILPIISIPSIKIYVVALFIASAWGGTTLTMDYLQNARRVLLPENIKNVPTDKEFAIVTKNSDALIYFKYGQLNQLNWFNSGWEPNFSKWNKQKIPVYGLVDCINFEDLCLPEDRGSSFYISLNKDVASYLDKENKLDLNQAIKDLLETLDKRSSNL